jgi:regulator of replication initiation timing
MNNDEKILKALEALQADVNGLKTDVSDIKQGQKNMATKDDVEQLENGQTKLELGMIGLERGQNAIKEIVTLMNQTLVKKVHNYDRRIENLEQHTGATNPTKS